MAVLCAALLFAVRMVATPQRALFDAPVHVVAKTGTARETITLEARATIDGIPYRSWGSYRADDSGTVDLATVAPTSGTYAGADPMGLFWSMEPIARAGYAPPSLQPIDVRLTAYAAHGTTAIALRRDRIGADVARLSVAAPFVGTLFSHRNEKANGIVVVLGGSEGGMDENRAAIIASHGFDALALAYFGVPTLPPELANIPLEYVDRAIDWIATRPELRGLPVALEGDSKGSELALLVAAGNDSVCGVVAFAPSSSVFEGFSTKQGAQRASWTRSGAPITFANSPVPAAVKAEIRAERNEKRPISYRAQYLALATPPEQDSTIPVGNIDGPILLVAGADDRLWPSDVFARRIVAERQANGIDSDQLLLYRAAGHQIDVPYMPTAGLATFDEGAYSIALGGTAAGYARADAAMWPRVIAFLQHLFTRTAVRAPSRRSRTEGRDLP
jgi:dienelactone hydrolase